MQQVSQQKTTVSTASIAKTGDTLMPDRSPRSTPYNRVKALRRDAGISRGELADAVGISPATLGNIEREYYEPGVLLAWRIAGYFELPLEAVFSQEPIPPLAETLRTLYKSSRPGFIRGISYTGSTNPADSATSASEEDVHE